VELKYHITFSEEVEDISSLDEEELTKIVHEIKEHLHKYLSLGGFCIKGDIEIEFDLEENLDV
jgi:hypothetical protein